MALVAVGARFVAPVTALMHSFYIRQTSHGGAYSVMDPFGVVWFTCRQIALGQQVLDAYGEEIVSIVYPTHGSRPVYDICIPAAPTLRLRYMNRELAVLSTSKFIIKATRQDGPAGDSETFLTVNGGEIVSIAYVKGTAHNAVLWVSKNVDVGLVFALWLAMDAHKESQ
ncbi:hypothetical protein HDV03_005536 [Kappamyces sp. JEL0829]|nr:hypothetical protein HDV03_005536 [Kappamyces sp. JEL0829]